MSMKKKHIIILLLAGCTITAVILQFFDMNLTMRTILVTLLMAFLFSIRAILSMHEEQNR